MEAGWATHIMSKGRGSGVWHMEDRSQLTWQLQGSGCHTRRTEVNSHGDCWVQGYGTRRTEVNSRSDCRLVGGPNDDTW